MTPHLDPHQFNAVLQHVERIMAEPISAELAAAYERIAELERDCYHALANIEHGDMASLQAAKMRLTATLDTSVRS
jgi:hypothetical protein